MASTVTRAPVFGNPYPVFGIPNEIQSTSKVDVPSPGGAMALAKSEPEPEPVTVFGIVSIVDERKMHVILVDDALIGRGLDH